MRISKRYIGAAAIVLIAAALAYALIETIPESVWHPRYVRLDVEGLSPRFPTTYQPVLYSTPKALDLTRFPADDPDKHFRFDFDREVADRWRLVAVGDIMAHDSIQLTAFAHRHSTNETALGYDWVLAAAKPVIGDADLAIGNLETVVSPDSPREGFPNFNVDPHFLKALGNLGFDALMTANNHILDHGLKGLRDTEQQLAAHGIAFTGTSGSPRSGIRLDVASRDAAEPLTVGIINFTDYVNGGALHHIIHHRSLAEVNLLCEKDANNSWMFRTFVARVAPKTCVAGRAKFLDEIASSIEQLRRDGADYVIVFLHGVRARQLFPNKVERRIVAQLAERGADAIIVSGSHTIMPIERLYTRDGKIVAEPDESSREHLVVYGLGNFLSKGRSEGAYGLVAQIDIGRDAEGRFTHAVTPLFSKSALQLEEFSTGERTQMLEVVRLQMLDFDAFLEDIRRPSLDTIGGSSAPAP